MEVIPSYTKTFLAFNCNPIQTHSHSPPADYYIHKRDAIGQKVFAIQSHWKMIQTVTTELLASMKW